MDDNYLISVCKDTFRSYNEVAFKNCWMCLSSSGKETVLKEFILITYFTFTEYSNIESSHYPVLFKRLRLEFLRFFYT